MRKKEITSYPAIRVGLGDLVVPWIQVMIGVTKLYGRSMHVEGHIHDKFI